MEPTIHINDRFIARKLLYDLEAVERGDIVVFRSVLDPKEELVKRVVALPHEEIWIHRGQVYIDRQPLQEPYIQHIDPVRGGFPRDELGPIVVPPQMLFVMGDNRDDSFDSRFWGFLPADNVIGEAVVRYWPPWRVALFP
jgi:signal peptidase I